MRTPAEIAAIAERHGLGDHADRLVARVRPGWRLEPASHAAGLGSSKIGGHPDFGAGETWPVNDRGIAMTFLAQIDTAGLPALEGWGDRVDWRHRQQFLRVFADLVDCPFEPGPAAASVSAATPDLSRTEAPPLPEPYPDGGPWDDLAPAERFHVLPEAAVEVRPLLTAPEMDPVLKPEMDDFSDPAEAYDAWADDVRHEGHGLEAPEPLTYHHLLGEAFSIQGDVREIGAMVYSGGWGVPADRTLADEDAWRVLLSLHNDERIGLHILDGGAFTVLIPAVDLAAGRYDRLVCSVDSS